MQNGSPKAYDDMTVAQIKEKAKLQAQKVTRNASALSLIGVARSQIAQARTSESQGDLKGAYSSYIKVVSLLQTFMDSPDFKAELPSGKRGVLYKEYQEFQAVRSHSYFHLFSYLMGRLARRARPLATSYRCGGEAEGSRSYRSRVRHIDHCVLSFDILNTMKGRPIPSAKTRTDPMLHLVAASRTACVR
jgi:hypothetical protein